MGAGVKPMAATSILAASSGGLDLLSGIFSMDAADSRASTLRSQARLVEAEANADASRYASEATAFKASQKMAFLKSGVKLEGSPLDILDETARVSAENISAIRARGQAQALSLKSEAGAVKAEGRLAFLKSAVGATKTIATTGAAMGWWAGGKVAAEGPTKSSASGSKTYSKSSKLNL